MQTKLNTTRSAKEDYSKIFNTMLGLSIAGILFITFSIPILVTPEVDAAEVQRDITFDNLDSIASAANNIPSIDVSYAFNVKKNTEEAKVRIDEAAELIDKALNIKLPRKFETYTLEYVGEFYITMYAATIEQCGSTSGITASGRYCTDDPTCWTVAVDPKIIPLGTYLKIDLEGYEDVIFRADDTGSAINNYDIDIFTTSEAESKAFPCYSGVKVWIIAD